MMNSFKTILLLVFYGNCCLAQNNFGELNDKAKKVIDQYRKKENIPGLSVTVSYNDTIIFSEGFGYADLENRIAIDPSKTKFRIASITKTMTAATIAKLWERGLIDYKKSVYHYLDSLPHKQYDFTVEQVGGHIAGLKRQAGEEKYLCDNTYSEKDFLRVFRADSLLFKPGERMGYSNYGFKLLGILAKKITGADITANHYQYVIKPLGLKNTVPDTGANDPLTAKFYTVKKNEVTPALCLDCTFKYASGCYLSTSEDIVKLGNGFLFIGRLLKKESIVKLITSQTLTDGKKTHYGFGFYTHRDSDGHFWYGHTGGYNGVSSSVLRIYPESKLVIAVLINTSVDDISGIVSKIGNIYINGIK